jgi:CRP-like cAMP-binding protein
MHQPPEGAVAGTQLTEPNRLLRAVLPDEYAWLLTRMENVTTHAGQVLAGCDEPFRHVYFPRDCVVSQVNRMKGGGTVEVGTIGNEGIVGLAVFLDADRTPSETFVQVAGDAHRMTADDFLRAAQEHPALHRLLHRYTHAFLTQIAQTASCNRAHTVYERCARWLLMTHDRVSGDQFSLTHKFLSYMLGVRRASVTEAAGVLEKAGLIRYMRGKITVVDREGLEGASCECYGVVRAQFEHLLGSVVG